MVRVSMSEMTSKPKTNFFESTLKFTKIFFLELYPHVEHLLRLTMSALTRF